MIAYLQQLAFWDWLALATALLIIEVFGAGGYLLWVGTCAIAVGVATFLVPGMTWVWQFLVFAVLAVTSVLLWNRYKRELPETD